MYPHNKFAIQIIIFYFNFSLDFWKITQWNLLSFPFLQLNLSPSLLVERTMKRNLYSLPENGRKRAYKATECIGRMKDSYMLQNEQEK